MELLAELLVKLLLVELLIELLAELLKELLISLISDGEASIVSDEPLLSKLVKRLEL